MNRALIVVAFVLAGSMASRAATSLTALGKSSSIVAVGTLTAFEDEPNGQFTLTLSVASVLKGPAGTTTVVAELAPKEGSQGPYAIPASTRSSLVGQTGLWFLSESANGYQVIPTQEGRSFPEEIFLPLRGSRATAVPPGTLDQQLLQYLVGWYQSLPNPTVRDDMRCLDGLQSGSTREDALAAADSLIHSVVVSSQVVGLTAAISLGSDDAVAALSASLKEIGSSPKFYLVTGALSALYQPHGAASIPVLKGIIDQHSAAPGINAAAGAALAKIAVKQTLPAMAELLNSAGPTAQLRAASFFGLFTLFADSQGRVSGGGPMGPFATDDTRRYMPSQDSGITPQQYALFWQNWWESNRARLGL